MSVACSSAVSIIPILIGLAVLVSVRLFVKAVAHK